MFKKYGLQVKLPFLILILFYLPLVGLSIFVYEYSRLNNENHLVKMIEKKADEKIDNSFTQNALLKFSNMKRFSNLPELFELNKAIENSKVNPKDNPQVKVSIKKTLTALQYFKAYSSLIKTVKYFDKKTKITISFDKYSSIAKIKEFSTSENMFLKDYIKTIKDGDLYLLDLKMVKTEQNSWRLSVIYLTGIFENKKLKGLLQFEFIEKTDFDKKLIRFQGKNKEGWLIWTDKMGKGIVNHNYAMKDMSVYNIFPELTKIDLRQKKQTLWDKSGNLLIYRNGFTYYKKELKKMGINLKSKLDLKFLYFYPNSMLAKEVNEFRNIILSIILGQILIFTPFLIFFIFKSKQMILNFTNNLNKTNIKIAKSSGFIKGFTDNLAFAQKQNLTRVSRSVESINLVGETFLNFKGTFWDGQKLNAENIGLLAVTTKNFKELENALDDLTKSSVQIEDINIIMKDMAFKTNLLALNASVEAARAGEEGKGFAVVAKAIRELAENSSSSTKKISKMVIENTKKSKAGRDMARKGYELLNTFYKNFDLAKDWIAKTFDELEGNVENIEKLKQELSEIKVSMDKTEKEALGLEKLVPKLKDDSNTLNEVTSEMNKIVKGE